MNIHPKTSGAAIGTATGALLTAILQSIHGVHLSGEIYSAITGFLGIVVAWLAPAPVTNVTGNTPSQPVQAPPPPPGV
jgi:hypothetical protein